MNGINDVTLAFYTLKFAFFHIKIFYFDGLFYIFFSVLLQLKLINLRKKKNYRQQKIIAKETENELCFLKTQVLFMIFYNIVLD